MNATAAAERVADVPRKIEIDRPNDGQPIFVVNGRDGIAVRGGSSIGDLAFGEETAIAIGIPLEAGRDYGIVVENGALVVGLQETVPGPDIVGGFHFAPGGNAAARAGGDDVPAINPFSVWDAGFRPACPDPRGMVCVTLPGGGRFWCDIYLLAADHLAGTSRFGVTIADGNDPPLKPDGKKHKKLDYDTAVAVMAHHGKGLLSLEEFFPAAFGVTEKTAAGGDPTVTGLDAARTSRFGLMQATGNLWVWGHDGDPDEPRASWFGGCWWNGGHAGSRYANVDYWPGGSIVILSARGRCDHLGT